MNTAVQSAIVAMLQNAHTTPAARFDPPAADEFDPYYGSYIAKVPAGDYLETLRRQAAEMADVFGGFTPAQADFAYAPGKWSLKQVLGHVIDGERVFSYRALSIGRGDPNALPGYSQDDWMGPGGFERRALPELLQEWLVVRAATLALAEGFPADAPLRRGTASNRPFTTRALMYIIAGHVNYHLEIVRERYMGAADWPR